jgi:hypothetical protein
MQDRRRSACTWIGWLPLVVTLADPVSAQAPQSAGQSTPQRKRAVTCASLPEPERRATEECKTEEEKREDDYRRRVADREAKERESRSSFLKWLHTDALWVPAQSGVQTYGLIGVHLAVAQVGRVHIFGPPGVILLRQRSARGTLVRAGLTWGMSVYLTDLKVPGTARQAQLYINLTKAWTNGDYRNGASMVGLSVTWKK